jgi:putative tryptophan/tyrosine transport system substrate-binding protein
MKRREFITLIGGAAAAWPLAARAQRPTSVVGVLVLGSPQLDAGFTDNLRTGLGAQGFVDKPERRARYPMGPQRRRPGAEAM